MGREEKVFSVCPETFYSNPYFISSCMKTYQGRISVASSGETALQAFLRRIHCVVLG